MCSFTLPVGAMPWLNHQGQAHIVSPAIRSPGPARGPAEVGGALARGPDEGAPWFRTSLSIDPQPASISPTVNIRIVFIREDIQSHSAVSRKACKGTR